MPMDDVGEFKVDMPMAFRTHMGVLVEQRMLGEGEEHRRVILHYLRTIGSRPQLVMGITSREAHSSRSICASSSAVFMTTLINGR